MHLFFFNSAKFDLSDKLLHPLLHVFFKVVTAGLMDIYQRILGLKFTKIEGGEVTCILYCVVIAC